MKLRHLTTSAVALILMAACTDATGVGVEPDDLAGTWTATSMVFTSVADNTVTVDVMAEVTGVAMTIVLGTDGSYTFSSTFPGEPNENEAGTYTVSGSTMTITPTGTDGPETMTLSRDGNTMTLTLADEFDFTDGVFVAATLVITLTR